MREKEKNDTSNQHFQVFTREQLLHLSLESLFKECPASLATVRFIENLVQPHLSLWEAFFTAAQSAEPEVKAFVPLQHLLANAVHVAVLYGEHIAWKSPDKWSYLFEVLDENNKDARNWIIAHPPANKTQIQQTEGVLKISLPPSYVQLLRQTNGLGLTLNETQFLCGVGNARADWDNEAVFRSGAFPGDSYHELASYWFQWQDVLAYERQRDRETGITTFRSDEAACVPFAYTIDDWCFDRSHQESNGEYPILFWDHELREATYAYPDFEAWFLDIIVQRRL